MLYFLDSGSYAPSPPGGYSWVERDQIDWYRAVSRSLNPDRLPALAFFHIPLPQYDAVWNSRPCRGSKHETVSCPKRDSGLFEALAADKEVIGVFVGHDHVNDFESEMHGIRLCYGRASGYHTYGREGFGRGARVIRLRDGEQGFTTWIRLHDGRLEVQPQHLPGEDGERSP